MANPADWKQREIVARIEAAFARIDRAAAEAAKALALLERMEQAALAKAFRGELVAWGGGQQTRSLHTTTTAFRH